MQFKPCKSHAIPSKEVHDYQKHWNAPARDLPDSDWNYHALSRCDPGDRDGNPSAGGGHFDSNWQISTQKSKSAAKRHLIWQRVEDNAFHLGPGWIGFSEDDAKPREIASPTVRPRRPRSAKPRYRAK